MTEQPVYFRSRNEVSRAQAERALAGRDNLDGREKDVEDDDPYELFGVRYPVEPGTDADRETARTLIEEFALQGWTRPMIDNLFTDPHAGHMHQIFRRRGSALIDELFAEVFGANKGRG